MDYEQNLASRHTVTMLLEERQKSEAQFAERIQKMTQDSNERLIRALAQWLASYTPTNPIPPEEERRLRAFTLVSLTRWIELQRLLADDEERVRKLTVPRPGSGIANLKKPGPANAMSAIGGLMESMGAKLSEKQKRDEMLAEMRRLCTQFVEDALAHLDLIAPWPKVGWEVRSICDELAVQLERLYAEQQRSEIDALNAMQRHLNSIRRNYVPRVTP